MKNLYILETDKPSRLYYSCHAKKYNLLKETKINEYYSPNQHIYITNDEEIKEGDWFLDDNNSVSKSYKLSHVQFANPRKIILTTDQDLINVQTIDDDFLEWFVKNQDCEYIETRPYHIIPSWLMSSGNPLVGYKIIIPKEEPKQIYYNTVGRENGVNIIKGQFNTQQEALDLANELNEKGLGVYYDWRETLVKEESKEEIVANRSSVYEFIDFNKQETLEEAAHKILVDYGIKSMGQSLGVLEVKKLMVDIAKWQQKRSYSEEEVLNITQQLRIKLKSGVLKWQDDFEFDLEEWFEKFKKK